MNERELKLQDLCVNENIVQAIKADESKHGRPVILTAALMSTVAAWPVFFAQFQEQTKCLAGEWHGFVRWVVDRVDVVNLYGLIDPENILELLKLAKVRIPESYDPAQDARIAAIPPFRRVMRNRSRFMSKLLVSERAGGASSLEEFCAKHFCPRTDIPLFTAIIRASNYDERKLSYDKQEVLRNLASLGFVERGRAYEFDTIKQMTIGVDRLESTKLGDEQSCENVDKLMVRTFTPPALLRSEPVRPLAPARPATSLPPRTEVAAIQEEVSLARRSPVYPGIEAVPEGLRAMPAAKGLGPPQQRIEAARKQLRVLEAAKNYGQPFVLAELLPVIADMKQSAISRYVNDLADERVCIRRTGHMRRGKDQLNGRTGVEFVYDEQAASKPFVPKPYSKDEDEVVVEVPVPLSKPVVNPTTDDPTPAPRLTQDEVDAMVRASLERILFGAVETVAKQIVPGIVATSLERGTKLLAQERVEQREAARKSVDDLARELKEAQKKLKLLEEGADVSVAVRDAIHGDSDG